MSQKEDRRRRKSKTSFGLVLVGRGTLGGRGRRQRTQTDHRPMGSGGGGGNGTFTVRGGSGSSGARGGQDGRHDRGSGSDAKANKQKACWVGGEGGMVNRTTTTARNPDGEAAKMFQDVPKWPYGCSGMDSTRK